MSGPRRGRARPRNASRDRDPAIGRELAVEIEALGRGGDGIGRFGAKPVFVPLALPGDRLTVRLVDRRGDGYAAEVIAAQRRAPSARPVCRHFGVCGGCQLQHVPPVAYAAFQRAQVAQALASRGLRDVEVRPVIAGLPGTRRRVRLAFEPHAEGLALGFRRPQERAVVDIAECPVTLPAIVRLLAPLRRLLQDLPMAGRGGEALITAGESGLDLLLATPLEPGLGDRDRLARFAERQDLARLTWRPDPGTPAEPVAARRPVRIQVAGLPLDLPAGAFLQATAAAETAIRAVLVEAVGDAARIADLFAGCGTFSLPLADEGRSVYAFEREPAMVGALAAAARAAGLAPRLRAKIRDLERAPLAGAELGAFDAMILDPPRAGARPQAEALAAAPSVRRLALVSCNPATFARDARILVDGGYRLCWVQPIDAFLWSAEIELVAACEPAVRLGTRHRMHPRSPLIPPNEPST